MMVKLQPEVLVLDVSETMSDLEPMRDRFEQVDLPRPALDAWFAATLRDGFALTAAGAYREFRDVAADTLRSLLASDVVAGTYVSGAVEHAASPRRRWRWSPSTPGTSTVLRRAGLTGIWVDRRRTPYPSAFLPPDLQVPGLEALADTLTAS